MEKLPKDLNVYQTSKCNFNCSFCSREVNGYEIAPDASPYLIERILKKFPISSCCVAGFGEPLMSKGVFDVIRTLNIHKIIPSIITNGSLIKERFSEILDVRLLYISVSLNTGLKESHKNITGKDCFEEVLKGIRMLVEIKRFPVMVSMVVLKDNYMEIPLFLEIAESLGATNALLINSLPYNSKSAKGIITEDDVEIIREIDKFREDFKGKANVSNMRYLKSSVDHCCDSPWNVIGVDGNGSVTGCRRVCGPNIENGNIEDKEAWENKYFSQLRSSVNGEGNFSWYCDRCFGNVYHRS